jgi:hypothetical protein
LTFDR